MLLTIPEHIENCRERWRIFRQIKACGGCPMCTFRQEAFGIVYCPTDAARKFPACMRDDRRPAFDLDHSTVKHAD